MRILVLMEDLPARGDRAGGECRSEKCCLANEHGLSFYVETAQRKLLVDTGASGLTWDNAKALGVDLAAIDTAILSHGHYDHTGGVMSFAARNETAAIYLNELAGGEYYNLRDGEKYIGIDKAILSLPQTRLLRGDTVTEIGDGVYVFGGVTGRRLWPEGNRILKRKTADGFEQDRFDHEQCVVVREDGRSVLIGGCAHNGVLNILDRYREIFGAYPDAFVSGFHMMKREPYTEAEIATIRETAEELSRLPIRCYTGHCTSMPAYEIMKPILGDRLTYFSVGEEINVR